MSSVLVLAACHHSSSSRTLESIGVTPANPTLAGRSTVQLSATGTGMVTLTAAKGAVSGTAGATVP